jgi:hypothetical protein
METAGSSELLVTIARLHDATCQRIVLTYLVIELQIKASRVGTVAEIKINCTAIEINNSFFSAMIFFKKLSLCLTN